MDWRRFGGGRAWLQSGRCDVTDREVYDVIRYSLIYFKVFYITDNYCITRGPFFTMLPFLYKT